LGKGRFRNGKENGHPHILTRLGFLVIPDHNIKDSNMNSSLPSVDNQVSPNSILEIKSRWAKSVLLLIFILAGLIRLYNIHAPGILVEREFTSAIFSRSFYFDRSNIVEPWRKNIARITKERQPVLEPPVTEYLVSLIYRATGREELWMSRILTSSFWLIGGIFMFLLTRSLVSTIGAIFATAYYLLVPSGVLVSRSFQPDSLMMLMFLISLYLILRYFEKPAIQRLLVAAVISGLALLFRPLVFFAIFGVFIALSIYQKRSLKALFERPFLIFSCVSLLLPLAYYGYGIFIAGFLRWKMTSSFRPFLLMRLEFWKQWLLVGINEIGLFAVLLALLGFPLIRKNLAKVFIVGFGIGYVVFGLVFNFHIHTHGYYHQQIIPLIAISAASLFETVYIAIHNTSGSLKWPTAVLATLILLPLEFYQVKNNEYQTYEMPGVSSEIGELIQHSSRTVFVAYHYGLPLQYYGELSGVAWPKSITYWFYREPNEKEKTVQERLQSFDFIPEYFVITNFDEYEQRHQDLRTFLIQNCDLFAETDQYLIYNGCYPLPPVSHAES
jgi:4-amino-4-deoxy-L-arabinose transferase-like glycosyltransferase